MTKADLINQLSMEHGHLSYHDVELALKETLEGLTNALSSGERIEVRSFGSFTMQHRKAHFGRNPKNRQYRVCPRQARHALQTQPGIATAC